MSVRDLAICVLNSMSEKQIRAFLTLFADEGTIAGMETEDILQHPEKYKRYNSVREMFEDTLNEENI